MIERAERGCHVDRIEVEVGRETLENAEKRCFFIAGMGCPTCETRVHNALLGVEGVLAVDVDLHSSHGAVWIEGHVGTEALVEAVSDAGNQTNHRYLAVLTKSG